jgi:drug/metabolite transporter (DMT)-like permease
VTRSKYLVLGAITLLGALGDVLLSRGMKDVGAITLANWPHAIAALMNPWVAVGTILLIGFLAGYTSALSWADLTFVLPATSLGYVLVTLLSILLLHEHVSLSRWLGVLLITAGVGFVAGGPAYTSEAERRAIAEANRAVLAGDKR